MATKLEALNNRGGTDYRTSHDIEGVIYILDNRIDIVNEIRRTDERIKIFIQNQLNNIIKKGLLN